MKRHYLDVNIAKYNTNPTALKALITLLHAIFALCSYQNGNKRDSVLYQHGEKHGRRVGETPERLAEGNRTDATGFLQGLRSTDLYRPIF